MASLNSKYRGKEGPTDVLSFGCDDPCPTPDDEPVTLGDVVIAPEVAATQAAEYGSTRSLLWSFNYAIQGIVYALKTQRNAVTAVVTPSVNPNVRDR